MKQIFNKKNKLECEITCEECLKKASLLKEVQVECKDARDWAKSTNICGGVLGVAVGVIAYDTLMDGNIDMAFAYVESLALAVSTYAFVVVAPVARYFAKKQQLSGVLRDIEKCKDKPSCGKIKEI